MVEFVKRVIRQRAFWAMHSMESNEGKDGRLVYLGSSSSSVSKEGCGDVEALDPRTCRCWFKIINPMGYNEISCNTTVRVQWENDA